jgi:hypothetical protein
MKFTVGNDSAIESDDPTEIAQFVIDHAYIHVGCTWIETWVDDDPNQYELCFTVEDWDQVRVEVTDEFDRAEFVAKDARSLLPHVIMRIMEWESQSVEEIEE